MNQFPMLKFGRTLTDREYGKIIAEVISKEGEFPIVLDFKGVISLGSSCGDEIFNVIAPKQQRKVRVINANSAIRTCLERVAEDAKVTLIFA